VYKRLRAFHRWIGLLASLFLLVISSTGFLLALKANLSWMRPPEVAGTKIDDLSNVISPGQAAESAFATGHPELREPKDIDRIDYRPKSNIFKILSKTGYLEIQVDGISGKVLSQSTRVDQITEDIHDLSFFAEGLHQYVLPIVALFLFFLALSGIIIFATPIFRRIKFRRQHKRNS
jgi:uncharacterized iron-regulated membrane protein